MCTHLHCVRLLCHQPSTAAQMEALHGKVRFRWAAQPSELSFLFPSSSSSSLVRARGFSLIRPSSGMLQHAMLLSAEGEERRAGGAFLLSVAAAQVGVAVVWAVRASNGRYGRLV